MRNLLLAMACVPLGSGMPEDSLKLIDHAGGKRVVGQVLISGGARPAYRMDGETLRVRMRQEGDVVVAAFLPVGIAFDLPKGQRSARVVIEGDPENSWRCGN